MTGDPFCISRKGGVSHAIRRRNQGLPGLGGDNWNLFCVILSRDYSGRGVGGECRGAAPPLEFTAIGVTGPTSPEALCVQAWS